MKFIYKVLNIPEPISEETVKILYQQKLAELQQSQQLPQNPMPPQQPKESDLLAAVTFSLRTDNSIDTDVSWEGVGSELTSHQLAYMIYVVTTGKLLDDCLASLIQKSQDNEYHYTFVKTCIEYITKMIEAEDTLKPSEVFVRQNLNQMQGPGPE